MKFERGTSNTFVLPARPTLTPSNWLLRFVRVENGVEMLCIADAYTQPGKPVQVTFTEVGSSPDPLDGEITLQAGQWEVHVYEQTSTTNLNYTQASREPFATLVFVEGAAIAPPTPTDPCSGDCPATTVNGTESDTPTIIVRQGGVEVGMLNPATGVHTVPECEDPVCDPLQIFVNTRFVKEIEDPCGASPSIDVLNELGAPAQTSIVGEQVIVASVTVLRDGLPYSTEVPGATVDVPSDCPACDPLFVTINGEVASEVPDPCGKTIPFLVVDSEGDPVDVTLNRGSIVVDALPCDPHLYNIQVTVEGVDQPLILNVDPSVNNTLNITIT